MFQSTLAPEGASDGPWVLGDDGEFEFQSTLAPEGASDSSGIFVGSTLGCFNPRSHPRVRATRSAKLLPVPDLVSIHARTRGCERLEGWRSAVKRW